mmetsp:Transcript_10237/g.11702  ORF Transcript_10237/g.11702 Transcript_10237/m.11702 type:complete len:202 (+) Transcript_10237:162-767(+)
MSLSMQPQLEYLQMLTSSSEESRNESTDNGELCSVLSAASTEDNDSVATYEEVPNNYSIESYGEIPNGNSFLDHFYSCGTRERFPIDDVDDLLSKPYMRKSYYVKKSLRILNKNDIGKNTGYLSRFVEDNEVKILSSSSFPLSTKDQVPPIENSKSYGSLLSQRTLASISFDKLHSVVQKLKRNRRTKKIKKGELHSCNNN